jgi:alpha-beta hydrolase superfamily lysophospholipase
MQHKEFNFNIYNTEFYGQYWQTENPKAIVALVHGMGEHSTRYADFVVPQLNKAGFNVIAFDQFGHGLTKGKRGHCPSYNAVLDSVQALLDKSTQFFGADLPVFLYGHSMGGNVVSNFILRRKNTLKGAIISSPMFRLAFNPPAWKLKVGALMKNIYPAFTEKTGLDASAISRNKDAVKKYQSDPLVHDKVTVNFSLPFFDAGEWAIANANTLKTPTLLIHGTADAITSHHGTQAFATNAATNATLLLFEGGYHELHNEPNQQEVLDALTNWLNQQIH